MCRGFERTLLPQSGESCRRLCLADLRVAFTVFCPVSTSVPSVTEISGMLHTSRPDNSSDVLLQLHTAPNCQYKVLLSICCSVTTSDFLYMLMIIQDNGVGFLIFTKELECEINNLLFWYHVVLTSGVSKDCVTKGAGTGATIILLFCPEYLHTRVGLCENCSKQLPGLICGLLLDRY